MDAFLVIFHDFFVSFIYNVYLYIKLKKFFKKQHNK